MEAVEDAAVTSHALALADELLTEARRLETRATRRRAARLARLLDDAEGRRFTLALTDEVMRIKDPRRAARHLRSLFASLDAPRFLSPSDQLLLRLAVPASRVVPRLVMALMAARVRHESSATIVAAERRRFERHAARRAAEGIRLNVNVLGEAILGEEEAGRRLDEVLERLAWPSVDYVSVKVSALCSQLDVLAFDDSLDRIAERLRVVFAAAQRHQPAKFVNLDMEEYRDLELTAQAFRRVLSEPEFVGLDAGIVLQAYLPDSYGVLCELTAWAQARRAAGGGRIKVRLVKGANLAMEQAEAELHGWEQAPYTTKAEVDANFKRLLDHLLQPQLADCVRVGVASHNVFDLGWALACRSAHGATERVELEMLQGMAEAQAQAAKRMAGRVLLYTPVARRSDFESTTAYLARRLDENTGPENFLRHVAAVEPGNAVHGREQAKFVAAVGAASAVSSHPRRQQDRSKELRRFGPSDPFDNEPDTDFALAANRTWIQDHLARWDKEHESCVGVVVGGREVEGLPQASSVDPSAPDEILYRYAVADAPTVERAVELAAAAAGPWAATPSAERRAVLARVAEVMARERGETIAAMVHDAGKTVREADVEVSEAVDFARWYGSQTERLDALRREGLTFDPWGVVVVASPWNFPYAIPAGGVLAALAAGNTVILKPAPETVLTAWRLARQCWAAGVPDDVLQFVPCPDDEVGMRLVTHPEVGAVILTGAWDTAQLFRSARPDLRLHAETSGKNAIVVTQAADLDGAVRDLVRSAFGHAGQKCSAASLAIVEAPVYDDPAFRRKLRDATESLAVGPGFELSTTVGPLIHPPGGPLADALCALGPGESWLVAPRRVGDNPHLWAPVVKLGVQPGSAFHRTECFGPVLGVMRAADLDEAIELQNATAFGLTGGIHSLDDSEVATWLERVEVGNAYVNRHITGAIVRRQPFGGWKRSVVGATAKAGGPNYLLTMGRWHSGVPRPLGEVHADFARWWVEEFAVDRDATGLDAEANVLRYRPYPRGVLLRVDATVPDDDIQVALAAAAVAGVRAEVSSPSARDGAPARVEADSELAARMADLGVDRVRALAPLSDELRRSAAAAGVPVDEEPVVRHGRVELLRWVREQSVTISLHRYGNVQPRRRAVLHRPTARSTTSP